MRIKETAKSSENAGTLSLPSASPCHVEHQLQFRLAYKCCMHLIAVLRSLHPIESTTIGNVGHEYLVVIGVQE